MPISGFRRAGHLPTLVAALAYFDVSFMAWVLLGALGAVVATDLGLTPAQKGLMVAVPPLGGAAFRLLFGAVADRTGMKRAGLVGLAVTCVPLAWAALGARTYIEVLGVGLLLGVAGASFAVALPLVSRTYPPRYQGLALGIAGAGNSGTVLAVVLAPRLAEHLGWHGVFAVAIVPVVVVAAVFAVLAREPNRPPPVTGPTMRAALHDARWLCAFYTVTFGGFVGLTGYLPIFFVDRFGVPATTAGVLTAVCAGTGSLLRPLGGLLSDRFGGARVLAWALLGAAFLTVVIAGAPPLPVTVVAFALLMGAFGMGNGAVFQLVAAHFADRVGVVTGLVGAAGGVGGFLLPFGLGVLRGATGTFAAGFLLVAAIAVITSRTVRVQVAA